MRKGVIVSATPGYLEDSKRIVKYESSETNIVAL